MPHAKINFIVQVNGAEYFHKQVYTSPVTPKTLFDRVISEYLSDFDALPDECTFDYSKDPFVVKINKEYTGSLEEFVSVNESVTKKRKRVIEDSDSESEPEINSESEDTDEHDELDTEVVELYDYDGNLVNIFRPNSEYLQEEPPTKRIKTQSNLPEYHTVDLLYNHTQKDAVLRALQHLDRPVTRNEIYDYFVNNNYLQVYEGDQKPTPLSLNHFVVQKKSVLEYRGRISRALRGLIDQDQSVIVTKNGSHNVYILV